MIQEWIERDEKGFRNYFDHLAEKEYFIKTSRAGYSYIDLFNLENKQLIRNPCALYKTCISHENL